MTTAQPVTRTFDTPNVSIVITREVDGTYTRKVLVAAEVAYHASHVQQPYPEDDESHARAAQSAICSLLCLVQSGKPGRFWPFYDDILRAWAARFGADGEQIVMWHRTQLLVEQPPAPDVFDPSQLGNVAMLLDWLHGLPGVRVTAFLCVYYDSAGDFLYTEVLPHHAIRALPINTERRAIYDGLVAAFGQTFPGSTEPDPTTGEPLP